MSLEKYTQDEIAEMSMLEIATEILLEEKKAIDLNELFDRIAELKGFTKTEREENIAQFYTDLNVDGRFITLGSNLWGLKLWYPVDQVEEELTHSAPKKKKKAAKKKKKVVEEEDFDDFEEEEDDFDEDLDDDLLDEDLDEDDDDLDDDDLEEDDDDLDFDDDDDTKDYDDDEDDDSDDDFDLDDEDLDEDDE